MYVPARTTFCNDFFCPGFLSYVRINLSCGFPTVLSAFFVEQGVEVVRERHQAAERLLNKLKVEATGTVLDNKALAAVSLIEVLLCFCVCCRLICCRRQCTYVDLRCV